MLLFTLLLQGMETTTPRPRGRPKALQPRKRLPLIQIRATQQQIAFIETAAWKQRKTKPQFGLEAMLQLAARVLRRKAP